MLKVLGIKKEFQQGNKIFRALNSVSFEVAKGDFVCIMGPSGSGKSTLLHLIGGLDIPTGGKIFINGDDLNSFSEEQLDQYRRKRVGFVFQFFNLLPTLSAEENVSLPLLLDGYSRIKSKEKAKALLKRVGLLEKSEHRPDQLSGGEMQRVAIARALVADPSLILADEPTGNLDSKTSEDILQLLLNLKQEYGQTIIMVTHNEHIGKVGDRILYIEDGLMIK